MSLQTRTFRDDTYLGRCNPPGMLNEYSALDYFCQSGNPFYDTNSINEYVKMQNLDASLFETMEGIRFKILSQATQEPHLYVVTKIENKKVQKNGVSTMSFRDLAVYYIIGGTVYQAPSLYEAISTRIFNCLYQINTTYLDLQKIIKYSPEMQRFNWNLSEDEQDDAIRIQHKPPYRAELQDHVEDLLQVMENENKELENK